MHPLVSILLVSLLLSSFELRAERPRRDGTCTPSLADLMGSLYGINESTPTLFKQTDAGHEDFHVTGVLSEDGTLRLGMHLEDSRGNRSDIDARATVRAMLKHFGKKVSRVVWKLSQHQNLDEHTTTVDSQLQALNGGWKKAASDFQLAKEAEMTGDEAKRRQTIQSLAILSSPVGTSIAFSQVGFRMRVTDTLGKEGEFISATVIFDKP